jgi:predicted ester cyclase/ketosteroid isomerase-like protein
MMTGRAELSKADLAAIREHFDSVARHLTANNHEAWTHEFTDDAVFQFMHTPAVRGRKAMRAWAEAMPKVERITFGDIQIHGGGDTAWATTTYRVTFSGQAVPDVGKQLDVLRRQADGSWLSVATSVSSDLPPAARGAAAVPADLGARIRSANDELLGEGNVTRVREIFAPDYVVHFKGEDFRGTQATEQYLSELRSAFPDLRYEIAILVSAGDKVSWIRTHHGTHKGTFMGARPSGRTITWRDMVVSRYAGEKIAEEWAVTDFGEHLLTP